MKIHANGTDPFGFQIFGIVGSTLGWDKTGWKCFPVKPHGTVMFSNDILADIDSIDFIKFVKICKDVILAHCASENLEPLILPIPTQKFEIQRGQSHSCIFSYEIHPSYHYYYYFFGKTQPKVFATQDWCFRSIAGAAVPPSFIFSVAYATYKFCMHKKMRFSHFAFDFFGSFDSRDIEPDDLSLSHCHRRPFSTAFYLIRSVCAFVRSLI